MDKKIDLVIEETKKEEEKLGTVGAIHYLIHEKEIDDDLLVIAGDNILEFDFSEFIATYKGNPLIALYDIGNKDRVRGRYGVVLLEGNNVTGFQEKPQRPKSTLVSVGCYIYPQDVLPLFSKFLQEADTSQDAPGYFNQWLNERKRMNGFIFQGDWFDIGDRKSYIDANMNYSTKEDYIARDSEIVNSTVKNSVILENTKIIDSSVVDCVIDKNSYLEGVELEKCIVGEGTKIRKT